MEDTPLPICALCGRERNRRSGWFLLVESRWQDKVKILEWHDQLALQSGVQSVWSATHIQELVVHWMTTGSLDYPFARLKASPRRIRTQFKALVPEVDARLGKQIGELSIHRESIQRVLRESPHSLIAILDALMAALQDGGRQREFSVTRAEEEALVEQGAV